MFYPHQLHCCTRYVVRVVCIVSMHDAGFTLYVCFVLYASFALYAWFCMVSYRGIACTPIISQHCGIQFARCCAASCVHDFVRMHDTARMRGTHACIIRRPNLQQQGKFQNMMIFQPLYVSVCYAGNSGSYQRVSHSFCGGFGPQNFSRLQ